jgi:hypothetical protein
MNNYNNRNRKPPTTKERAINRILDAAWDNKYDLTWQQGYSIYLRSRELKAETEGDQDEKDQQIERSWQIRREQRMNQAP